jgi:hypothetical protein
MNQRFSASKTFIIMTHIPDLTLVEHLTGFPLSWPFSGKACRRTKTLAYIRPIFKLQRKKGFVNLLQEPTQVNVPMKLSIHRGE